LIPHHEKHTGNDNACRYTGTKLNKRRSFLVHDCVRHELLSGVKKKVVSEVLRKYDVCVCVCVCEVRWYFWHHQAKAQIQKSWSWNFLWKLGDWNRNI